MASAIDLGQIFSWVLQVGVYIQHMHVAGQTTSPWAALLKISYGQLPVYFSADDEINEASC